MPHPAPLISMLAEDNIAKPIMLTPFQAKVYKIVSTIPRGETRTYKWVAEKIGSPKASRAVGQALKRNPFIGKVPCHRVICSDGSLGGFSRGKEEKRRMFNIERSHY